MNCVDIAFRVIELIIAASIPALIAFFGFRLTGKIEDMKNESASKHLWRTKWTDVLFQKHLTYCDNVIEFTAIWTRLLHLLDLKESNSAESLKLQENSSLCTLKLIRTSQDLKLLSINAFGRDNKIEAQLNIIWGQIHLIVNNKRIDEQANLNIIFDNLSELNRVTEDLIEQKLVAH